LLVVRHGVLGVIRGQKVVEFLAEDVVTPELEARLVCRVPVHRREAPVSLDLDDENAVGRVVVVSAVKALLAEALRFGGRAPSHLALQRVKIALEAVASPSQGGDQPQRDDRGEREGERPGRHRDPRVLQNSAGVRGRPRTLLLRAFALMVGGRCADKLHPPRGLGTPVEQPAPGLSRHGGERAERRHRERQRNDHDP
jgi:hypothetical protein